MSEMIQPCGISAKESTDSGWGFNRLWKIEAKLWDEFSPTWGELIHQ